jgi:hypothetical protein
LIYFKIEMRFKIYKSYILSLILSGMIFSVGAQANFVEVSLEEGMGDIQAARGVAIADFDNDGFDDILIPGQPSKLLKNNGDLTFTDYSNQSGFSNYHATSALWFDADNDGMLDALLAGSEESVLLINEGSGNFSFGNSFGAAQRQALLVGDLNEDEWPDIYSSNFRQPNHLLINQGNGFFVPFGKDVIEGTLDMGAVLIDFDEDGDLDIYQVFDGHEPNELLINNGNAEFINSVQDFNLDNESLGMGIEIADFDRNGIFDFYITNLGANDLLIAQEDGTFNEIAMDIGVNDFGMGWGVVSFDYDNNGWEDIYFTNEFLFSPYPNRLLSNEGNLNFVDVTGDSPIGVEMSSYACGTSDLNNDGKLDLVVINRNSEKDIRIFTNEGSVGNWLQLSLIGTTTNKFGIGARVEAYVNGAIIKRELKAGSGYRSQNSYRLHFGLGSHNQVDSLFITWPDGQIERYNDLNANTHFILNQGISVSEFNLSSFKSRLAQSSMMENPKEVEGNSSQNADGQSVARIWNEILLDAIRGDFARPTVHARNLYHFSLAIYDSWTAFDPQSLPIISDVPKQLFQDLADEMTSDEVELAKKEAISFAAYRLISHRFKDSPSSFEALGQAYKLMQGLGYDPDFNSMDYSLGDPAALGNYIADKIINLGLQDGSNEAGGYANLYYAPLNDPLKPQEPGNPTCEFPNRWQQLELIESIDQSGNPVSLIQDFLSPEWGQVSPFALTQNELTKKTRDGHEYLIYHDVGAPPKLIPGGDSDEFKWNFETVLKWSSQLDHSNELLVDISPSSVGNLTDDLFPTTFQEYQDFYDFEGADPGSGYASNPKNGAAYKSQIVKMGDYTRVLAEFWADGPHSETPPGHWFTILNYVTDHPQFERKFEGKGIEMNVLEWDVKTYLILGGAMHDAAITAWGIKGYYDYARPINAIRYLADRGQSSDPTEANYHPDGLRLIDGLIELIKEGDPLVGKLNENIGKLKVHSWKGPDYISNPQVQTAGVDWILAENWWPYQRPSFVTPPFAGYVSGHSTYSRAAAEVLTLVTGDEYFPGGIGEFEAEKNEYLVFENGPSETITLQWAKYRDASDQCSLSRIWGGIHPPVDDIPGRKIGALIGLNAFNKAVSYFGEPVLSSQKIDQNLPLVYPNPIKQGANLQLNISGQSSNILSIYDLSGHQIFKGPLLENFLKWEFGTGLFVILIEDGNNAHYIKVIAE